MKFVTGMTQDRFVAMLNQIIGRLDTMLEFNIVSGWKAFFAKLGVIALQGVDYAASLLWNAAAANPVIAGVVIAALAATTAYAVCRIPVAIVNAVKKKGKVKQIEESKKL